MDYTGKLVQGVVLACDLEDHGATLGYESKVRCVAAMDFIDKVLPQGAMVELIFAAGMADRVKYPKQKKTMAAMMIDFMLEYKPSGYTPINASTSKSWGTAAEIKCGLEWQQCKYLPLHVFTSSYHAPRVRMISRKMFGADIVVCSTPYKDVRNGLIELVKYPIQWAKLTFGRA